MEWADLSANVPNTQDFRPIYQPTAAKGLNQLHKQGRNFSRITQVIMALVVARFQYVLPVLTGQLSADDLHTIYAIFNPLTAK